MRKERYKEYLLSDIWKQKKSMVISRDKGTCQQCGSKTELEVHHLTYDRVGEELTSDLISLCWYCHKNVHSKLTRDRSEWSGYINENINIKPINVSELTDKERDEYYLKMALDI